MPMATRQRRRGNGDEDNEGQENDNKDNDDLVLLLPLSISGASEEWIRRREGIYMYKCKSGRSAGYALYRYWSKSTARKQDGCSSTA
ncbi:hypothetical protein LWI29_015264 [Acer saccharum]|uniref:Uncharacterized protein n=1 Tax=Acer saccharum TaxID=4024 RepID=A0AA39VFJ9_ACESA|nr:hypothetical protein LWI29_015264 [Acer saccharum]